MIPITNREILQKRIVDKAVEKKDGILYIAPRVGKTFIALKILMELGLVASILVAYPNIPIRNSWEEEIRKRGFTGSIEFTTFSSLGKVKSTNYDAVIIDECHALSERNINTLNSITWNKIRIGLSGTISKETRENLERQLNWKIIEEYSIEQAVKEGVISDYNIEIHLVPLDNKILKEYTKKRVKRTEKQQFDHLGRTIDWMESTNKSTFFKRLERMRLIQNSLSKLQRTKELAIGRNLIFCGTTVVADQIGCATFHNKSSEKQILHDFCDGKIKQLAVCKMLNMGVTINNLDNVILNYTDSSEENLVQKICRCLNYDYIDKTAKITIISSTESVELQWLKSALKSLDKNKISWIK